MVAFRHPVSQIHRRSLQRPQQTLLIRGRMMFRINWMAVLTHVFAIAWS